MLYLQKNQINNLVMNVNNNSRETFTGYTLTFTHIMSSEVKSYTISTSSPQFFQNIRYCTFELLLNQDDLNYEGEYQLEVYGLGGTPVDPEKVFTGIVILEGTEETPFFTEYISPNEENENYIYIS
jgi:hypothetical protein